MWLDWDVGALWGDRAGRGVGEEGGEGAGWAERQAGGPCSIQMGEEA